MGGTVVVPTYSLANRLGGLERAPRVAVVVLDWNSLADTVACVESLLKSTYPNYHVVVIDNGSVDDSAQRLRTLLPVVTVLLVETNRGYTGGNNFGIAHALSQGAECVSLLNNDTLVEPTSLEGLVAHAERDPSIGLVSPVIHYLCDPGRIQFCGARIDWRTQRIECARTTEEDERWERSDPAGTVLWGTALLVRRRVIETIGPLDDSSLAYWEDIDYPVRISRAGHRNAENPALQVAVLPTVNTAQAAPPSFADRHRDSLAFVGGFAHRPKVDAVLYFCREVMPLIVRALPGASLTIVGQSPPAEVRDLAADPCIVVTGYVPKTLPYLNETCVSVAPLRYGSGMKGKITEAMAAGIPVVTTSIGAEGMDLRDRSDVLIADAPEDFARAVVALCQDPALHAAVQRAAGDYARRHLDVTVFERALSNVIRSAMETRPKRLALRDRCRVLAQDVAAGARVVRQALASRRSA